MRDDQAIDVDVRAWRCSNGHVLGQIHSVEGGTSQLLVYAEAVDDQAERPEQVVVRTVVEYGYVRVFCQICGTWKTWTPNREAYERMMKHFQKRATEKNQMVHASG